MRVVLLNGPKSAGKDAAGRALLRAVEDAEVVKMAGALKAATHALFGLTNVSPAAFESVKDEARPEFFGMTPREAYITVSERMVKPVFGHQHFGRVLVERIKQLRHARVAVVTDSGFAAEAMPLIEAFGADRVLLLHLHRPGYDFEGDSRGYIDLPGVRTIEVQNTGTETNFGMLVVHLVESWLNAGETSDWR